MNCSDWEERIALHAGGDLPPSEAAEVEQHLRACATCQALAGGLTRSLAILREAHSAPVAAAHFSAVRTRVVAELEQERRRGALWARRRAWGFGLAAAVVALLVMLALRPGRTLERRAPVLAAVHPRVIVAREPVVPVPPHRRVARRVVRSNVPDTSNPEPLIVKLQTADPNVVIYWIEDRKRGD